jgi:hypothetical protein
MTMGASSAASAVDDAGRCGNWFAKFVHGGCFVAGTLVTLTDLPRSQSTDYAVWSSDPVWHGTPYRDLSTSTSDSTRSTFASSATLIAMLASPTRTQVPIEQVPLGARVPTKNPKPWEYDDSLPEPIQADWAKIAITLNRNDGGIVDAELIRPRSWVKRYGIQAKAALPINIPELEVSGLAFVNSVEACPEIASGDGSVITGRFLTREVNTIIRAEILGPNGTIETIEGTPIHPIWSVDRNDWVPLGELEEGEHLQAKDGLATVVSIALLQTATAVYNVEVHGEHVYEVGILGILVHNANECFRVMDSAEYVGAQLGKWADSADDFKGFKWAWGSIEEATSWLNFLEESGETGGFITRIDTLQDILKYQEYYHPPQGIARLIPLGDLGKAIRLFD